MFASLLNYLLTGQRPDPNERYPMDERGPLKEGEYYRGESPLARLAQVYFDGPPSKKKPKQPTEGGTPWAQDRKPNYDPPEGDPMDDSMYAPAIKDVPQREWFPETGTRKYAKLKNYRQSENIEDRRPIAVGAEKGYVRPEKKPVSPLNRGRMGAGAKASVKP